MKIRNALRRFGVWFDTTRRQSVQAAIAAIAPLLLTLGILTEGALEQWTLIAGAVLAAVGPLVSLVNLTRSQFASWLITGARGVLYGGAAVVVPALAVLGYIGQDQSTQILSLLSHSLTVLAAVVAIFTAGKQAHPVAEDPWAPATHIQPADVKALDHHTRDIRKPGGN